MKVIYIATHLDKWWEEALGSVHGQLDYIVHLEDQHGWDWAKKVDTMRRFAWYHYHEPLIFMDLWDTLFVGDPEELEAGLKALTKCTTQCSSSAWPRLEMADRFPDTGKWRYVNGSGVMGTGEMICDAIQEGKARYPIKPAPPGVWLHDHKLVDNDARFWQDLYLDDLVANDFNCRFVQPIIGLKPGELVWYANNERFYNKVTDTMPQFLHAAGGNAWEQIPLEAKCARVNHHFTEEYYEY